jgi:hypothetical protein
MSVFSTLLKSLLIYFLCYLILNPANAVPLLGLTLMQSKVTDVQQLITNSGAQITEDSPLGGH